MTGTETLMVIGTAAVILIGSFFLTIFTWKMLIKGIKYSVDEIVDTWKD